MPKPDFSDFYRFIASLGLILVGMALILPWLFLREPFDTTVSAVELARLTPAAQEIVNTRQYTALWYLRNITWISISVFIVGIVITVAGMSLWWTRKQSIADHRERLELEELMKRLAPMSGSEVALKAVEETKEAEIEAPPGIHKPDRRPLNSVQKYLEYEKVLTSKLENCVGPAHLLTNYRTTTAPMREFDAILLTNGTRPEDIVLEFKVASGANAARRLRDLSEQVEQVRASYVLATKRQARVLGVLVYDENENQDRQRSVSLRERHLLDATNTEMQRIEILSSRELHSLTCSDIERMLQF